jgi:hypothetical protein
MYIDPAKTPGTVSTLNMNNRPIFFQWGPAELGPAYRNDGQTNDRIVLSAEGEVVGWDYRVGLNYGQSKRDTRVGEGYVLYSKIQAGFDQGILNPFGLQDAAGTAYLKAAQALDYTYRLNKAFNESIDATVSRPIWALPGGDLTLALSGEVRRDSARTFNAPLDYVLKKADGSYNIDASGNVLQSDLVGETPQGVAKALRRDIASMVVEIEAPITKSFSLNGAVRADHYKDLAQTTVNRNWRRAGSRCRTWCCAARSRAASARRRSWTSRTRRRKCGPWSWTTRRSARARSRPWPTPAPRCRASRATRSATSRPPTGPSRPTTSSSSLRNRAASRPASATSRSRTCRSRSTTGA